LFLVFFFFGLSGIWTLFLFPPVFFFFPPRHGELVGFTSTYMFFFFFLHVFFTVGFLFLVMFVFFRENPPQKNAPSRGMALPPGLLKKKPVFNKNKSKSRPPPPQFQAPLFGKFCFLTKAPWVWPKKYFFFFWGQSATFLAGGWGGGGGGGKKNIPQQNPFFFLFFSFFKTGLDPIPRPLLGGGGFFCPWGELFCFFLVGLLGWLSYEARGIMAQLFCFFGDAIALNYHCGSKNPRPNQIQILPKEEAPRRLRKF